MAHTKPDALSYDNTYLFDALTNTFKPSDSVPASFLMDIFGLSRADSSVIVREWRSIAIARCDYLARSQRGGIIGTVKSIRNGVVTLT